jgi:hypothetical protein
MPWTVILIDPALECATCHVLSGLSHDSKIAYQQATTALPNKVIVALVRGDHSTGTHMPQKAVQVIW